MKVQCQTISKRVSVRENTDGWLTVGAEYDVLEIFVDTGASVHFRIKADQGTPALFPSANFVTVSDQMPTNWRIQVQQEGRLLIGPASWMEPGYWDRFFDRDQEAEEQFRQELAIIQGTP